MKDQRKTKKQLIEELTGLRQRILEYDRIENERNQAEEALRESETRYRSIFNHSLDAILLTAPDGQILVANPEACSTFGYTEAELRQIGRAGVVDPTDPRLPLELEERTWTGKFKGNLRFIRKDRSKFEAEVSTAVFRDRDGFERASMIIRDITERKRAEMAMEESERRLRELLENVRLIAVTLDIHGNILFCNDFLLELTGWQRDEIQGQNWFDNFVPPEVGIKQSFIQGVLRGSFPPHFENEILTRKGDRRLVSWNNTYLRDSIGKIIGANSIGEDITERKRTEEELQKNRGFLNSILDTAPMLIYVTSADNRYLLVNKAWEEFVGRDREEVIGRSMEQIFSSKTNLEFKDQNKHVVDQGLPLVIEEQVAAPGGTHHFHTIKFPLFDDHGKVEAVGGISLDITEKKQGEEKVREMSRFLATVIDNANIWVDVLDKGANVVIWNKAAETVSGYSSQEVVGHDKIWEWLYPGENNHETLKNRVIQLMRAGNEERNFETMILTKAGEEKTVSWHSRNLGDDKGSIFGSVVLGQDITERKQAEEALRQSEQELATIFDGAPILMLVVDRNYRVRKVNRTMQAALGVTEADLEGVPCGDLLRCLNRLDSPEGCCHGPKCEACRLRQAVERTLETTVGVSGVEAVFETETKGRPCRSSFSLSTNLLEIDDEAMVLVCLEDITQRKRTEEALKETNQNLQALIQASPLAIVAVDSHKNILKWNQAAERIFGWSEKEVLGKPTPIIPKEKEEEVQELFQSVLEGKTISGLETRRQKKDGTLIDVNLSTAPLYGENFQIRGSIAMLEDNAERKKTKEERQKLIEQLRTGQEQLQELSRRLVELQETERRDLARELHDEVGQNLTALSINLNIIQNLMPDESASKAIDRINDSQRLLEETVVCIRDVMARLRPPVLDDYGLVPALNWYSGSFMKRTEITAALILKGEELAHRLPSGDEIAMFRIAQEALNNVAKHAKASQVTLILENREESIRLIIADNGLGFDPEVHHQPGVKPEWGLISMRERAQSIGGQFRIETAPGKGTKIIVEVHKTR